MIVLMMKHIRLQLLFECPIILGLWKYRSKIVIASKWISSHAKRNISAESIKNFRPNINADRNITKCVRNLGSFNCSSYLSKENIFKSIVLVRSRDCYTKPSIHKSSGTFCQLKIGNKIFIASKMIL